MWRDTPAQTLQYSEEFDQEEGFFQATPLARLAANLDVLRDLLDAPDTKRDFSPVHAMNRFNAPVRLPDAMRAEVEQRLVRVMEASGSSKVAIEAGLLRNLGRCVEVRADLTPAAAMPLSMNGEELRSPDSSS